MEAAYDVFKWLGTLRWPLDPNPKPGVFAELHTWKCLWTLQTCYLPKTFLHDPSHRLSEPESLGLHFYSNQAILPAVAQAVVLEHIIQQLGPRFTKTKCIPGMPKKKGIKTLRHFGHSLLQERTGIVLSGHNWDMHVRRFVDCGCISDRLPGIA